MEQPQVSPRLGRGGHRSQEGAEGKLDWGGRGDGFYVTLKCRLPLGWCGLDGGVMLVRPSLEGYSFKALSSLVAGDRTAHFE